MGKNRCMAKDGFVLAATRIPAHLPSGYKMTTSPTTGASLRRTAFAFALALLGAAVLPARADIIVGQSAPLSGGNADFGNDIRAGANAWFKRVNDGGGIGGQKIRLVTLDDKNDAKLAADNTARLINNEGAIALFGYASSTLSLPAMPFVESRGVPFFAPFTGADTIRKQNEYVYTIRVLYSDEVEKLIGFWGGVGLSSFAVLHYDDAVGQQNFDSVATALKKYGKTPASVAIPRNAELPQAAIDKVLQSDPQMVVITTLAAPAARLIAAVKARNRPIQFTSLSFAGVSQYPKLLGKDAAGITVALTVPNPKSGQYLVVRDCNDAWAAGGATGAMSVTALEACIAARVLVEGLKKAGRDLSREGLHRALSSFAHLDVGGLELAFKPGFHHGGRFVDIAVIRTNGELRN
jgi:ABC-type branched-subunit amino acid transport system substrate-binding protein